MIDIISASIGFFCGGCVGFIASKLSPATHIDEVELKNYYLKVELRDARDDLLRTKEDLLLAQKERLNLAAKVAHDKPKRDKHGRFISKNKEKK